MNSLESKLILLDGNSLLYRAFFALPLLSNSQGKYTNAVYGFTTMLMRLIADEQPTHIGVAFDVGRVKFRQDLYAQYKGTRDKAPGELVEQMPVVREVLQSLNISVLEAPGYEADDIIGTLATCAAREGLTTLIVSGDKDLLQLVGDHVTALLTRKGITEMERYDTQRIRERYSLSPRQIIDLKGLMGDTSDNIPGVPGVGEKTAIKLLQQFPTVEELLSHVSEVSGAKLQEKLKEHANSATMSKQLATILLDIPIETDLSDLAIRQFDRAKAIRLFRELEFKSLLARLPEQGVWMGTGGVSPSTMELEADATDLAGDETAAERPLVDGESSERFCDVAWETVDDLPAAADEWAASATPIAVLLDYVNGSQQGKYQEAQLNGMALATAGRAWYVPFAGGIPARLKIWLEQDVALRTTFDVKAAIFSLDVHGVTIGGKWFDVLLTSYLLHASEGQPEIDRVVSRELSVSLPEIDLKNQTEAARKTYFCTAAHALCVLQPSLEQRMKEENIDALYEQLELPLTYVLADMERKGVKIDVDQLRSIGQELQSGLEVLTTEIHELAGQSFNINSPKQLAEILFEKLGLPSQKKTKTGYSTSADILEKLIPYHDIIGKILHFRQLGKLQSTYVEGLLKVIKPETSMVHTCFNQAMAATGRLASIEPNLQNIPIRMEEGRRLRKVFVPSRADWKIVSADYSQIELRVLAHISGDENLCDAFAQNMDIHTRTASEVFEVAPEEVTSAMRRQAKAVNFGIVYGISDYGLSQNLDITRAQAAAFIENYLTKFSGVRRFMEEIVAQAKRDGYVTTLLNRRRYLPDIQSRNFNLRSFAERTAMNTPIQGSAADIIKVAMVRLADAMKEAGLESRLLLQVHDELILEAPEHELEALVTLVVDKMETSTVLRVPLRVDVHVGDTWYDAK